MKTTEEIEKDILGKINEFIYTLSVDTSIIDAAYASDNSKFTGFVTASENIIYKTEPPNNSVTASENIIYKIEPPNNSVTDSRTIDSIYKNKFDKSEQNFIKKNPSFTMMTLANALHYSGVEERARKFIGGAVLGAMGFKFGEELSTETLNKYYSDQNKNNGNFFDDSLGSISTDTLDSIYTPWTPFETPYLRKLLSSDISDNTILFSNMFRFSVMSQPDAFTMISDDTLFNEYLKTKGFSILTNELRYFRNKNNKFDVSKIFEMIERVFCQNLTIPGVNLEINIDYVYGVPRHVITGRRFDPIQITFFNDSHGILRRFFFLWMMLIEQNDLSGYRFFPNEIKTRLRIEHFESFVKGSGYSIIVDGAFPSSISDVQLDHAMGDLSKFTVTFDYNQYYYDVYHQTR